MMSPFGRHHESLLLMKRALSGQSLQFRLLIATFGDSVYRDEIIDIINQGTPRVSFVLSAAGLGVRELEQKLALEASRTNLIHVIDVHSIVDDRDLWMNRLNYAREALANDCPASVVLWMYDEEVDDFARLAPDLWAWRRGVYEFTGGDDGKNTRPLQSEKYEQHDRVEELAGVFPESGMAVEATAVEAEVTRGGSSVKGGPASASRMRLAQVRGERALYDQEYDRARSHFTKALDQAQRIGDQRAIGQIYSFIGRTFEAQGNLGLALRRYRQAASVLEDAGDVRVHGVALGDVARALQLQGSNNEAYGLYRRLLATFEDIGELREQSIVLAGMARIDFQRGEFNEAEQRYDQAIQITEAVGDQHGKAILLGEKARILERRGNLEQALALQQEQRRYFEEIEDKRELAVVLGDLARIRRTRGEIDRALALDAARLEIHRTLGNKLGAANALWAIGRDRSRKNPEEALVLLKESYQICVESGQSEAIVTVGRDLAQTLIVLGRVANARAVLENVRDVLQALGQNEEALEVEETLERLGS